MWEDPSKQNSILTQANAGYFRGRERRLVCLIPVREGYDGRRWSPIRGVLLAHSNDLDITPSVIRQNKRKKRARKSKWHLDWPRTARGVWLLHQKEGNSRQTEPSCGFAKWFMYLERFPHHSANVSSFIPFCY